MPDIRLRIELLDTDPLVWRCVLVPEQINLHRLHEVIQEELMQALQAEREKNRK